MDIRNLEGSIVALVTPFTADGDVDFEALGRLVDFHLEAGTDAILTLGTTGESSTMTDAEDDAVCAFVVERVSGRIPVIAGSGSNSTQTMLAKSLSYQRLGADGLLIITPYYNKANEEGIYRHLATVADAVDVPCILYNIPGRTGCSISVRNVERLAAHENVMAIKEASGSIAYAADIAHTLGPDFKMFSGNDDMVVPLMSLGASGVISVWANVQPALVHDMVRAFADGDVARARAIQIAGLPLVHALFSEVNPIPVKEALAQMGMIGRNYRLPLCPMAEGTRAQLVEAMKGAGILA
ncbi:MULTISPECIES: 4-hydroxy-tetrahydrodipicolinate synthase [Collinsella]|uniref:4-hydroxy-tetrahydrodipicolinate synthase n=1 Tax=Collinsella TaxID=102106 RepID=UPI000B3766FB|nr:MULTISPECIES: 4-hydroxy-tetrahydrodipicolinate synthase [Collinsella]MBM6907211.1 4-hydroxy-tetrahydrodipicolinate synthase [Collinsella intestinalis]MBM6942165.1 4-hydroxy-tetrahydrodipicolinate synthase [Collinsella intestinalis]OUO64434.1 4-hydroxy-tetrahydrodipicolinate synthase [Collinsella sp. An268]